MKRLLVIWTARHIPTCWHHFEALTGVGKLWINSHTEWELADALPGLLENLPEYELVGFAPDDAVFSQQSVDAVFDTLEAKLTDGPCAVGGWSNCDFTHHYTNIGDPTYEHASPRDVSDYQFHHIEHVAAQHEPFRAGFCGHSLLAMHRNQWLNPATSIEPLGTRPHGCMSDYNQCHKLHTAQIPLWIDPRAFIAHLKLDHMHTDTSGWKQLDMTRKVTHLERETL